MKIEEVLSYSRNGVLLESIINMGEVILSHWNPRLCIGGCQVFLNSFVSQALAGADMLVEGSLKLFQAKDGMMHATFGEDTPED